MLLSGGFEQETRNSRPASSSPSEVARAATQVSREPMVDPTVEVMQCPHDQTVCACTELLMTTTAVGMTLATTTLATTTLATTTLATTTLATTTLATTTLATTTLATTTLATTTSGSASLSSATCSTSARPSAQASRSVLVLRYSQASMVLSLAAASRR